MAAKGLEADDDSIKFFDDRSLKIVDDYVLWRR